MINVLSSSSADSLSKKALLEAAVMKARLEIPERFTNYCIPTSDSVAIEAAILNERLGINAMSLNLVSTLFNKALAYQFAKERGLEIPDWIVPMNKADLMNSGLKGRVIVKPTTSSGAFCNEPWGYKVFDSASAFSEWLDQSGLAAHFWLQQQTPNPNYGRFLVMQYHDNPDIWGVHVLKTFDGGVRIFGRCYMHCVEPTYWIQFCLSEPTHSGWLVLEERLKQLANAAEFGAGLLYVQAIDVGGKLMPIDFNLRHGTLFAQYCEACEPDWFSRYLESLLGIRHAPLEVRSKHFCIGKIPLEKLARGVIPDLGRYPAISPGPSARAFDPSRPYDVAYKDFLFIAEAQQETDCMRYWQEYRIETEVLNGAV